MRSDRQLLIACPRAEQVQNPGNAKSANCECCNHPVWVLPHLVQTSLQTGGKFVCLPCILTSLSEKKIAIRSYPVAEETIREFAAAHAQKQSTTVH